jgi:two-component system OmpR family sensor kinase
MGTPLTRIPTSTSLTLLDAQGTVVGGLGGDFNTSSINDYLAGLLPEEVAHHGERPFTIEAPGPDFRVIARALPNNGGTVVAAQSLRDLDRTTSRLGFLFALIGFGLLLMIAIAARAVIKVGLRPLEDAEKTAEEIASGNYSARMPETNPGTEVGRLVTSLNTMLARIEDAFAARGESENKLRRFVADASHELRTPITAIRGFSELHRQGAVTGEKETSELIGRIENESKRMGSLVEDLLLLARLDQAREMESKPVDINKVVEDAVISARAAGPEHPVTLHSSDEEIFTLGDEVRIHQVVANLLANARAHTPAGTPITVSVLSNDAGVEISVADKGPGLSAEDQRRIFERFYRADASRVRNGDEGSGLGLSIVDAVMRAHGGSVSVKSSPGAGATFLLNFPRGAH